MGVSPLRLGALVLLVACSDPKPSFERAAVLGGVTYSAQTLNEGRRHYRYYCMNCHGELGDGNGRMGRHQDPPPRDLRLGFIEYASVPNGDLPTDDDLIRTIKRGVAGTAMLPLPVPDEELEPLLAYVKTLSPRWTTEQAGEPVAQSDDSWGSSTEAIARGERVYHANCIACHPSYQSRQTLGIWLDPNRIPARVDLGNGVEFDEGHEVEAAPNLKTEMLGGGDRDRDLYRSIAAGIGGAAMPGWKHALAEQDLWAVVRYIRAIRSES